MLDAASEMIPVALHYIGEDPNSFDPAVIAKAQACCWRSGRT
jgi:putrescine transport system substrate-binding protein